MLGGRFLPLIAALAVAGSLAGKRVAPAGAGTLRTDTPTFVALLIVGDLLIVALLTFVPALLLGPVVQGLTDSSSEMRRAQNRRHRHRRRHASSSASRTRSP